jgi:hypothetical protein
MNKDNQIVDKILILEEPWILWEEYYTSTTQLHTEILFKTFLEPVRGKETIQVMTTALDVHFLILLPNSSCKTY